jgi:hypothetical protein
MKRKILLGSLALAMCLAAPFAFGHPTGHESRSPADCEKLPGTQNKGERGNCLKCVQDGAHHFHPDMKKGNRCHPDDGKRQ